MKNEPKNYSLISQKLKSMNLSKEEFKKCRFWKIINENKDVIDWSKKLIHANVTSMCLDNDPDRIRIRSDLFLCSAHNKENVFLIASFKFNDGEIYHYVLSSKWFENYVKHCNVSNSFINFSFQDLLVFKNNPGYQYKKIRKDITKFIFLIIKDQEFTFDKLLEYHNLSNNIDLGFNYLSVKHLLNDPKIPNENKSFVLKKSNYGCLIHRYDKNSCRTKIDWEATKKAVEGTNLNVPIDIHHFIPRSVFKKAWINQKVENLDWSIIHSTDNLIPLCQICHQSIHNQNKELVLTTFQLIKNALIENGGWTSFLHFLKNSLVIKYIDELLNEYMN